MSKHSKPISIASTLSAIRPRARLPLTITALLLSAQAQAMLPTPLSLVTTGGLGDTTDTAVIHDKIINVAITNPNNTSVNSSSSQSTKKSAKNSQNANADQLLTTWRAQVQAGNLAQHITWRRLLYVVDDKKGVFAKKKYEK